MAARTRTEQRLPDDVPRSGVIVAGSRAAQRPSRDARIAGVSLVLGVVALALAETAVAEVLLAVLMASILIVWAVELMDHAGILPGVGHRTGLRYS